MRLYVVPPRLPPAGTSVVVRAKMPAFHIKGLSNGRRKRGQGSNCRGICHNARRHCARAIRTLSGIHRLFINIIHTLGTTLGIQRIFGQFFPQLWVKPVHNSGDSRYR